MEAGAYTEASPSVSEYFTWINNSNEGSCEGQTLANLAYFAWLKEAYGMRMDIYAWDAGNIDGAAGTYGTMENPRFCKNYPRKFAPIAQAAAQVGMRLGLWAGADGFGDTPESARARREMLASLCRDDRLRLFKFDTVCGCLRPERKGDFLRTLEECRKYAPDLIVLNHRNDLGEAQKYVTTFLWESAETYIDVHAFNRRIAPHHRACALDRGYPEGLARLCEDHGVCLSSCLDYWQDELVIQAFARCLILAPQIYGNPWLLRDDEQAQLAYLVNLQRRFRDRMIGAIALPDAYGPLAVSRGDGRMRFVVLRNPAWTPRQIMIHPRELGLEALDGGFEARIEHPFCEALGRCAYTGAFTVTAPPFRTLLLRLDSEPEREPAVSGVRARVIPGAGDRVITLYGDPGECADFTLQGDLSGFSRADLEGRALPGLLRGESARAVFPGEKPDSPACLGALLPCPVPRDAERLYEATCFAADNNALEARSLFRSGKSKIPAVNAARDWLFGQDTFVYRGVWDRYAFDGREDTFFSASVQETDQRIHGGALRVDFSALADHAELTFLLEECENAENALAQFSRDLSAFFPAEMESVSPPVSVSYHYVPKQVPLMETRKGRAVIVRWRFPAARYLRVRCAPVRVRAIRAFLGDAELDAGAMRASNLFSLYERFPAQAAWGARVTLGRYAPGSVLCVGLDGVHGVEGAYAAMKIGNRFWGAPDRSPSYPCNQFEHFVRPREDHYTYYFPLSAETENQEAEIFVLGMLGGKTGFTPRVYVAAPETPALSMVLTLRKA